MGSPWICPRCGAATNRDACPSCFHERPYEVGNTNAPGSYLGIVQGPKGYPGLPRAYGIGCLIVLLGLLLPSILRLFGLMR